MSMAMDEQALRQKICEIGRLMFQRQYVDGTSGNISARLDEDAILVTPSGVAKGFLQPEHLLIVDLNGKIQTNSQEGGALLRPTSEIEMHLGCYRKRDDVQGVIHAHPQNAVSLTICGIELTQPLIPEMIVSLGIVPTTEYATPASSENREAIRDLILKHDAIMLAHHGSVTVGRTVWEAYLRLETLEHNAAVLHKVIMLGGARQPIARHQIDKLLAERQAMGLLRSGERDYFMRLID